MQTCVSSWCACRSGCPTGHAQPPVHDNGKWPHTNRNFSGVRLFSLQVHIHVCTRTYASHTHINTSMVLPTVFFKVVCDFLRSYDLWHPSIRCCYCYCCCCCMSTLVMLLCGHTGAQVAARVLTSFVATGALYAH